MRPFDKVGAMSTSVEMGKVGGSGSQNLYP